MPRRNARISDELRKKIVEKYEDGEDYIGLAADIGIKRTTAIAIAKRGRCRAAKRGGRRGSVAKITPADINILLSAIERNPTITLRELRRLINNKCSIATIWNHLQGQLYSYKLLRSEPVERNSTINIEKRKGFAVYYQQETRRKVHVDESNFNLFCRRNFGRAPVGQRATATARSSKGRNLCIILAVDDSGSVVHYELHMGSIKNVFASFMTTLSDKLFGEDCVIFMDNAPIHKRADVFAGVQENHIVRHFDAPYSPQLNPCEGCFSVLKSGVKEFLARQDPALDASNAQGTLRNYREALLETAAEQGMQLITRDKVRAFYRKVDQIIANCANGLPLSD